MLVLACPPDSSYVLRSISIFAVLLHARLSYHLTIVAYLLCYLPHVVLNAYPHVGSTITAYAQKVILYSNNVSQLGMHIIHHASLEEGALPRTFSSYTR
jgi:hypothetical protein